MQRSDTQAILERLEKLERQNRRMKRAGVVILVIASAILMMGQARPNRTIEANAFVLKDAGGKTRANLMLFHGNPILTLNDEHESPLVTLTANAAMSFLHLSNPEAPTTGFDILVTSQGPVVDLTGPKTTKTTIGTGTDSIEVPKSNTLLELTDTSLSVQNEAGAKTQLTGPRLTLSDLSALTVLSPQSLFLAGHNPSLQATMTIGGFSAQEFIAAKETPTLFLNVDKDGPFLNLTDIEGFTTSIGRTALETPRTGATSKTSAASIVLFGKDKKVLWSAP